MDATLIAKLRAVVGEAGIITDEARRLTYECDGLAFERCTPLLVLLPADTREAAACLQLLHAAGVPVVPRGAGTGLSGGATPVPGSVVVGSSRMRRILELNAEDRYARVEAGLVNVHLTKAASRHGLIYAADPSSQRVCTLGGNVAFNASGPHSLKYGNTSRQLLGLVIVTPEGEVLDLTGPSVDPDGYDLAGLFVGSEGMFGLVTEITLELMPPPEVTETVLALYPSLDAACDAVSEIVAERLEPSALEIIDRMTIETVEASVFAAGYPADVEAVLLLEVDGSEVEVDANVRGLQPILERNGALELRRARDAEERLKLWAGRKGAYGAAGRLAPDLFVADVVVPRNKLRELVRYTTDLCREQGLRLANVLHAGDGNLHPNISYDRRDAEELARVLAAGDEIAKECVRLGGTLSGEHGIGLEKRELMHLCFTAEDLGAMDTVRAAWDPARCMNPGKLIPEPLAEDAS